MCRAQGSLVPLEFERSSRLTAGIAVEDRSELIATIPVEEKSIKKYISDAINTSYKCNIIRHFYFDRIYKILLHLSCTQH